MLSHGEESGRDSDEWREARGEDGPHCPVSLMRKRGIWDAPHRRKRRRTVRTGRDGQGRMKKRWGGERRRRRQERDAGRERQGTGEGEGRCSKVVKRKKESGSERERREEKKWGEWKRGGGESCVERGADKGGEEENRKRVIMLPSSLFPVSLKRALLIGWRGRRGYVYTSACPPGKGQFYIGGSCFD